MRNHINHLRDLIHCLQFGDSERRMAHDMRLARQTVQKYHKMAKEEGYLEAGRELPTIEIVKRALESDHRSPASG